eukprot:1314062-Alexandrium_andersonii.AAC.1
MQRRRPAWSADPPPRAVPRGGRWAPGVVPLRARRPLCRPVQHALALRSCVSVTSGSRLRLSPPLSATAPS